MIITSSQGKSCPPGRHFHSHTHTHTHTHVQTQNTYIVISSLGPNRTSPHHSPPPPRPPPPPPPPSDQAKNRKTYWFMFGKRAVQINAKPLALNYSNTNSQLQDINTKNPATSRLPKTGYQALLPPTFPTYIHTTDDGRQIEWVSECTEIQSIAPAS